ncbi:hypothetical protein FRC19_006152 [Serendipita sp. 401]|nr:hypothetical protein FRC19_006152 [Serendipita sp. 401]KAG8832322.1 hypothetical protein FRC18_005273 [Serendipita sp. 400]KAG9024507.1 hypothetical protein FS842_005463 [Serendipita sp. 407]
MPSDPSRMGHQSPSVTPTSGKSCQGQIQAQLHSITIAGGCRRTRKNPNQALPIVDRERRARPMNMRELEERIPITISAASGRAATQKMDFIWSESQNISMMISQKPIVN